MIAGNRFVGRYEPDSDSWGAYAIYNRTRYSGHGATYEDARAALSAAVDAAIPVPDDAKWGDPSVPGVPIPEED